MPESQLFPFVFWNFKLTTDGPGKLRGEVNHHERYKYTAARQGDGLTLETQYWFEQELAIQEMLDLLGDAPGNPQFTDAPAAIHLNGYANGAGVAHYETAIGTMQMAGYANGAQKALTPDAPGVMRVLTYGDGATRKGSAGGTVYVLSKTTYQASWQEANRTFVLDDIATGDTATYEEITASVSGQINMTLGRLPT